MRSRQVARVASKHAGLHKPCEQQCHQNSLARDSPNTLSHVRRREMQGWHPLNETSPREWRGHVCHTPHNSPHEERCPAHPVASKCSKAAHAPLIHQIVHDDSARIVWPGNIGLLKHYRPYLIPSFATSHTTQHDNTTHTHTQTQAACRTPQSSGQQQMTSSQVSVASLCLVEDEHVVVCCCSSACCALLLLNPPPVVTTR